MKRTGKWPKARESADKEFGAQVIARHWQRTTLASRRRDSYFPAHAPAMIPEARSFPSAKYPT